MNYKKSPTFQSVAPKNTKKTGKEKKGNKDDIITKDGLNAKQRLL